MTMLLTRGHIDTNSQQIIIGKGGFVSNNSNTRILTLGSSAISIEGESFGFMSYWLSSGTGLTVTLNTAVVTVAGLDGRSFTAPGTDWNGMSLILTSGNNVTLSAAGATFKNITRPGNSSTGTFKISGSFKVTGALILSSTVASMTVQSFAPGTPYVITYYGTKSDTPNVLYSADITTVQKFVRKATGSVKTFPAGTVKPVRLKEAGGNWVLL